MLVSMQQRNYNNNNSYNSKINFKSGVHFQLHDLKTDTVTEGIEAVSKFVLENKYRLPLTPLKEFVGFIDKMGVKKFTRQQSSSTGFEDIFIKLDTAGGLNIKQKSGSSLGLNPENEIQIGEKEEGAVNKFLTETLHFNNFSNREIINRKPTSPKYKDLEYARLTSYGYNSEQEELIEAPLLETSVNILKAIFKR